MNRYDAVLSVIETELAKGYEPGKSDCFMLGLRLADALDPGLGLVERYGGSYTTLAGALRVLRRHGFETLRDAFEAHFTSCPPAAAGFGDLVIVAMPARRGRMAEHVGICVGTRFLTKTEAGRSWHGIGEVTAAFRTGPRETAGDDGAC